MDEDNLVEHFKCVLKRIHEACFGRSGATEGDIARDISLLGTIKERLRNR